MVARKVIERIVELYIIFASLIFSGNANSVNRTSNNEGTDHNDVKEIQKFPLLINFTLLEFDSKNNRLYHFGIVYKGNFFQAIQFCNYHGMDLVSIETLEENNFLFNGLAKLIGAGGYGFWSSGTRLPENHWVWLSTGRPVTQGNWTTSADSKKSCIEVQYFGGTKSLAWTADDCNAAKHYICEAPKKDFSDACPCLN